MFEENRKLVTNWRQNEEFRKETSCEFSSNIIGARIKLSMVFEKQDTVISKLTLKDKLRTFLSENLENQSWRKFEYQITVYNSQNQMVPNHSKKTEK